MSIVDLDFNVDDSTFESRSFEPAPAGVYIFSVSGKDAKYPLEISNSKEGAVMVVSELRIEANADGSETPHKGKKVFENFVLKKKDGTVNDFGKKLLVQFALACGVTTEEQVRQKVGIDLNSIGPDTRLKADLMVKTEDDGNGNKTPRNRVKNFLWKD
jgi:hypothetical protein